LKAEICGGRSGRERLRAGGTERGEGMGMKGLFEMVGLWVNDFHGIWVVRKN